MNEIIEPNEQTEQVETAEQTKSAETPTAEPTEAEEVEEETEETEETEEAEETETADDTPTKSELAKAKNELKEEAEGGASFCDMLFATMPWVFEELKKSGKTLHGLYEYCYSYAIHEYVKKHGRVNGGMGIGEEVVRKYLDPSVKEGFKVDEPKTKSDPKPKTATAKETIVKTAKKAAAVAKKEKETNMTFDFGF